MKAAPKNQPDGSREDPTAWPSAREFPSTRSILSRRRGRLGLVGAVGVVCIVVANNAFSGHASSWKTFAAEATLTVGGVLFFAALLPYCWLRWYEGIVRRNPWVEMPAVFSTVRVGSLQVARVVSVTPPGGDGRPVVRMLWGRSALRHLPGEGVGQVLVAGRTKFGVAFSSVDGASLHYGQRSLLSGVGSNSSRSFGADLDADAGAVVEASESEE